MNHSHKFTRTTDNRLECACGYLIVHPRRGWDIKRQREMKPKHSVIGLTLVK